MAPPLLNEQENLAADAFFSKHRCSSRKRRTKLIVTVTPTGIGYNIRVKCHVCKKTKDVTDYASW